MAYPRPERKRWQPMRTLGSGSFGEVLLYKNQETNEVLAVKKCKVTLDIDMQRRWRDEVAFMKDLEHPHIVKGLPVPEELEAIPPELPRLGMEFCSRGDLRRKLSEPPHVCGLPEVQVLFLARHISSAIEYLHSQSIIHRDIKPENIMIQEINGRLVYKLTDLGFAKDGNRGEPATSFVGTREYMAAELYSERAYTKTVDHWSFGTVISESISGSRPFMLSGIPLVHWHSIINKKDKRDIGYYEDSSGEKKYSKSLPEPNQLCRPMKESLEAWLGLMLRKNPTERGGAIKDGRQLCFHWLDMILQCKIVHVRCMIDGQIRSYPTKPFDTVQDLQKTLSTETCISAEEQLLLLGSGTVLADQTAVLQTCFKEQEDNMTVYMFRKSLCPYENFYVKPFPDLVTALLNDRHACLSEPIFKSMWKHALHSCQYLVQDGMERLTAFKAFTNYHLKVNALLVTTQKELKGGVQRLVAKKDFFKESHDNDTKQYAHQAGTGILSPPMYKEWNKALEEVKELVERLQKESAQKESQANDIQCEVINLQKASNKLKNTDELYETRKAAVNSFVTFKEENKVKRREDIDCTPIKDQVNKSHQQYCELNKTLFSQLRHVHKSCQTIKELMPLLRKCLQDVENAEKGIAELQKSRQVHVWELLKITVRAKKALESRFKRQMSMTGSLTSQCPLPPSPGDSGENAAADSKATESMMVIDESTRMQSQLDVSFEHFQEEQLKSMQQIEKLDWNHLTNAPGEESNTR